MEKEQQKVINEIVRKEYEKAMKEFRYNNPKPLRTCTALVYETENYYILRSYNTITACIDKRTKIAYDFLRMVYKYTRTSARHFSKFCHDYTPFPRNYNVYRYYPV